MNAGQGYVPSSILVVYVSRIGDTMLITPAVRALARNWPGARIDFLGSRTSADVFRNLSFVSNVGTARKKSIHFLGWLRPKSYDLALVYGYDGDGPFVEYALRVARRVIAFVQRKASLNRKLLAAVEKPPFRSCHAVDHFLSLLKPLGVPPAGKYLSYVIAPEEEDWARRELSPLREKGSAPLIGLQMASFPTKGYRDWPVGHFIELCRRVRMSYPNAHFLVFGSELELERTTYLHTQLPECSTHYAGRLSLRQSAALMGQLDLYVGVDTGPTHIMGALHRPMVALYHGYSPSWLLAPLEHPCLYVVDHPQAGANCSPDDAMAAISVGQVWLRVAAALERHFAHAGR